MGQAPRLSWADGTPVSEDFEDPYYSKVDGRAEAAHVFLAGNGLPERFRDGFHIAELGFGTGLNLGVSLLAWGDRPGRFRYTSFEAFPMTSEDMAQALLPWPEVAGVLAPVIAARAAGATTVVAGPVTLELVLGDARETLPRWDGQADAWYLDGFNPARNPELWEPPLMQAVSAHTATGGSFGTYSAAGAVRRALEAAGFQVSRRPGFGRKRHMTVGRRL